MMAISEDDISRMNELRRQSKSLREIGDLFGVSYLTVRIYVDQEFRDRKARRRSIKYEGIRRPKPEECELCGARVRLEWHHWDDDYGNMGVYLCWDCHRYWEAVDYDEAYGEGKRKDAINLKRWEEENYRERSKGYEEPETKRAAVPLSDPFFSDLRSKLKRSTSCLGVN